MRRFVVVFIFFFFSLLIPSTANATEELCCPAGYGNNIITDCPAGTNLNTTCCKRTGVTDYIKTPKIACTATPPENLNLCCPQGFGTGIFDCPFGVNKDKQCCNRKGVGEYQVVDKVQCNAENDAQAKNTSSSLPPCIKWVYAFPKNNLDSRLNDIVIPTGNPEYIDPDFKTRKCSAIQTGIGTISTNPQGFVKSIFNLVLGLAGGIALILIIISGYKFMASQGNPEATKAATEQLTSSIIGLLFIIFAFVILQTIGVDILKIPGFTK